MPILHSVKHEPEDKEFQSPDLLFWCPACQCAHGVWVRRPERPASASQWLFKGTPEKPTFEPSLLITRVHHEPPVTPENLEQYQKAPWPQEEKKRICHLVVTDGILHYQPDCTHAFAGKSIPMEDF